MPIFEQKSDTGVMGRNIYIIGAQSTGKTMLVTALEAHFATLGRTPCIIREVARGFLERQQYKVDDIVNSPQRLLNLQRLIIEAQAKAQRDAEVAATGWLVSPGTRKEGAFVPSFISDRSAIDPIVYARQYVGVGLSRQLMASQDWQQMLKRMAGSLIVVCKADVSWLKDDGVRLMPTDISEWLQTSRLCCQILSEASLTSIVLPPEITNIRERVGFVLNNFYEETQVCNL